MPPVCSLPSGQGRRRDGTATGDGSATPWHGAAVRPVLTLPLCSGNGAAGTAASCGRSAPPGSPSTWLPSTQDGPPGPRRDCRSTRRSARLVTGSWYRGGDGQCPACHVPTIRKPSTIRNSAAGSTTPWWTIETGTERRWRLRRRGGDAGRQAVAATSRSASGYDGFEAGPLGPRRWEFLPGPSRPSRQVPVPIPRSPIRKNPRQNRIAERNPYYGRSKESDGATVDGTRRTGVSACRRCHHGTAEGLRGPARCEERGRTVRVLESGGRRRRTGVYRGRDPFEQDRGTRRARRGGAATTARRTARRVARGGGGRDLSAPSSDLESARASAREGERKTVLGGDLWWPPKPPEFDPDPRPVAGPPSSYPFRIAPRFRC